MKIICDKCKSDRVENFGKEKPKEEVRTMEQVARNPFQATTDLVYRYTMMVLLCKARSGY